MKFISTFEEKLRIFGVISLPGRQFMQWVLACISITSQLKSNVNLTSRKKIQNVTVQLNLNLTLACSIQTTYVHIT